MMPEYLAGLPRDRGFSPLTQVVLGNPWAVHLPSLLISGLTVANLLGKLTRFRSWTFCAVACFAVFVLLSALWLVGTTNPFGGSSDEQTRKVAFHRAEYASGQAVTSGHSGRS
jgi:hypothetical protein